MFGEKQTVNLYRVNTFCVIILRKNGQFMTRVLTGKKQRK